MLKKVLVVYYSQTGQLTHLVENVTNPLKEDDSIELVFHEIKPKNPYPFPWQFMTFMDTFPESVYLDPCELESFEADTHEYDLVILAYQVWFLSPSIPVTSFLKSDYAKEKLRNKPIITLIGCRNMWIMAQEKMKTLLGSIGAKLIDNIVLVDQGSSLATFITTPRWMMSGKKDELWGIFPKAGISEEALRLASRFGYAIKQALAQDEEKKGVSLCHGLGAVSVDEKLIKSEKIGTKSFHIWGKLIRACSKQGELKRKLFIMLYTIFLVCIIITVVPLNMLIQTLYRKLNKEDVLKQKALYELPTGSGTERMKEFSNHA